MSIPIHYMRLFQKPAVGDQYISQYTAMNYKHKISALGGYDSASCDIAVHSRDEGLRFLDQFLGNRVAFYGNNPIAPFWEGFINRMSFSFGGVQYTISLDEMSNSIITLYTPTAGGTTQTAAATATVKSALSQSLYGVKALELDLGLMISGTGTTLMQNTALAQRALPKASIKSGGGIDGIIHIDFLGFYHTLSWAGYRDATTGSVQLGNFVDTIIGGLVNGTTFFDNTDLTRTVANTNTIDKFAARGETTWDMLMKIREIANGSTYYVIGISPTDFRTGTRRFYYEQANLEIVYTTRVSDGLRIRNLQGQLVDPWLVQPNGGIQVQDRLIGWNGIGDNPDETWIMSITYDANTQRVTYAGDDDQTAEGVFNLKRFNKGRGRAFGAARRLA